MSDITSAAPLTPTQRLALLTRQEVIILELSAQGLRNAAIGARIGLTEKGVKWHKTNVYKSLGVTNIIEALVAYDKLTKDVYCEPYNTAEYQTPAYTRIRLELEKLRQNYAELVIENNTLRQDFRTLVMNSAPKKTNKTPFLFSGVSTVGDGRIK